MHRQRINLVDLALLSGVKYALKRLSVSAGIFARASASEKRCSKCVCTLRTNSVEDEARREEEEEELLCFCCCSKRFCTTEAGDASALEKSVLEATTMLRFQNVAARGFTSEGRVQQQGK